MVTPQETPKRPTSISAAGFESVANDGIDLRDIYGRTVRGFVQIVGLAIIGFVLGGVIYLLVGRSSVVSTTTRVVFSFPGLGKGKNGFF